MKKNQELEKQRVRYLELKAELLRMKKNSNTGDKECRALIAELSKKQHQLEQALLDMNALSRENDELKSKMSVLRNELSTAQDTMKEVAQLQRVAGGTGKQASSRAQNGVTKAASRVRTHQKVNGLRGTAPVSKIPRPPQTAAQRRASGMASAKAAKEAASARRRGGR